MSIFIYRFILYPFLFILAHVYAIFNKKIRKALLARYSTLMDSKNIGKNSTKTVLLHTASMGEFEHVKPLIRVLKQQNNIRIIVTFFSPSGFDNISQFEGVDHFLYIPFDFGWLLKKFYENLKPDILIIAKHDAWLNQVLIARKMDIPVFLINASLSTSSSRISPLARWLLKPVYSAINKIYTISEEDEAAFKQFFPGVNIKAIGDTKFDQVVIRRDQAFKKDVLPKDWVHNAFVVVLGSIWKEDAEKTLPGLKRLLKKYPQIKVIAVPHNPTEEFLSRIMTDFNEIKTRLYSKVTTNPAERIILIDRIGILADLYKYAQIAFVGGSFKQGIHNVMEAAVYGIPVLYGPVHQNASEAVRLNRYAGSFVFNTDKEFEQIVERLINHNEIREEVGKKTKQFALANMHATEKLVKELETLLRT